MPQRAGGIRKKKRSHKIENEDSLKKVPRCFVIRRGKVNPSIKSLVMDWRQLLAPHCAIKLRESNRNTLKDFTNVAGVFGVSHLVTFSQTNQGAYMRLAKLPEGPTLTFKLVTYSLMNDIRKQQKKPRVSSNDYLTSPLLILNGFRSKKESNDQTFATKLVSTLIGNMFPAIDPANISASSCRRAVLFNLDQETQLIDIRHYCIIRRPAGLSHGVKKLIRLRNHPTKMIDLAGNKDVSEFILNNGGDASDSDVEEKVEVTALPHRSKPNEGNSKIALSLQEIGPRLTVELLKIEEGVFQGKVLYHRLVTKTEEELSKQQAQENDLKKKRKRQMELEEAIVENKKRILLEERRQRQKAVKVKSAQSESLKNEKDFVETTEKKDENNETTSDSESNYHSDSDDDVILK